MLTKYRTPASILVIGYGNTLRSDDGVGYRFAEEVEQWQMQGVRSLPVHQLTPELAHDIAQSDVVWLVDAIAPDALPETLSDSCSPYAQPIVQPLLPTPDDQPLGHSLTGRSLLALAQILYQRTPTAYWMLIPCQTFEFGETLSALTEAGLQQALSIFHDFVTN